MLHINDEDYKKKSIELRTKRFNEADANSDGKLSLEEFKDYH